MSGRITLPMAVYTAEVVATYDLSPTLRRVVLGGDGLAGYRTTGVGDEYIRLLFPAEGTTDPVLPTITDGNLDYEAMAPIVADLFFGGVPAVRAPGSVAEAVP